MKTPPIASLRASFPVLVLTAALVLRLLPVLLTRQLGIGLDDMFQYDMLARSLASGNGFRWYTPPDVAQLMPYLHFDPATISLDPRGLQTTFRAPLYPYFVALIYSIFGTVPNRFFDVRLAQTVLGSALAPLTYWTAQRVLPAFNSATDAIRRDKAARLSAWTVAGYPVLVIYPLGIATENLFFPLLLGGMLALLNLAEASKSSGSSRREPRGTIGWSILAGLLLGLAALTRSVILPFAIVAIAWIALALRQHRAALLAALGIALVVTPWIVRNTLVSRKLTGIETSMGYNLYVGYHPQSTGTFTFGPSLDLLSILDDTSRDEIGTQRALEFIRQDPARFPYLATRRLGYFFNLDLRAFTYFYGNGFLGRFPLPVLVLVLSLLALPFAVLSLSATWGAVALPWGPETLLLLLLFVSYLVPHVFILSEERFHLAIIPFMAVAAAHLWTHRAHIKKLSKTAVLVTSMLSLLLIANWYFELRRDGHALAQLLGPNGNQLNLPY